MAKKKVEIYKIEYKIADKPDISWVVFIAAYTSKEATDYLGKFINRRIAIDTISTECRLDAVTDEVRRVIAQPMLGKEKKDEEEKQPLKRSIVPK